MIRLEHIQKVFGKGRETREILADLSLDIPQGSFLTLFGPNGCGKSTLMNILVGIDQDFSGSIKGFSRKTSSVGFVFQDYRRSLLPWLSVDENILYPLKIQKRVTTETFPKLENLKKLVGFDMPGKSSVFTLSGGQAQLVCLLRALMIDPELLILDEPFSALDYERTLNLRQKIMEIVKELGLTVLFISHDLEEALYLGDSVIFLSRSPTRIVHTLPVNFARPRNVELVGTPEFAALKLEALKVFEQVLRV
jgi:NitT/TauT family transport system ATP-binding protein